MFASKMIRGFTSQSLKSIPRYSNTFKSGARKASTAAPGSSKTGLYAGIALAVAAGAGGYWYVATQPIGDYSRGFAKDGIDFVDYQKVYNDIAKRLESEDYDDGSFGPVLVRLAWHCSGTYDVATNTGGSNGATMRHMPESGHGANRGLDKARAVLEPVKADFPEISFADLWTLAGVVAIQEMGGPTIQWRPGRVDKPNEQDCPPDGRLPDGSKGTDHIRDIFYRMGFNDQEIVALSGAHALGRCHTDRSGFDGPWTFSPTVLTNAYYQLLLEEDWVDKKWKGPKQFVDKKSGSIMMLPSDWSLLHDKSFRPHVEAYAKDEQLFFSDFSKVFQKLLELGVPFRDGTKEYEFKRVDDQTA